MYALISKSYLFSKYNIMPTSYCTTMNKIISKLLTNRLQNVREYLIDPSQAASVPGRIMMILSHELVKGYNKKGLICRKLMALWKGNREVLIGM